MTPIVAYAGKMTLFACLCAGELGAGLARATVLGVDVTSITSISLGGVGLLLIGVRMWRDDKLVKREKSVSFREGYLRGVEAAGGDEVKVLSRAALEAFAEVEGEPGA